MPHRYCSRGFVALVVSLAACSDNASIAPGEGAAGAAAATSGTGGVDGASGSGGSSGRTPPTAAAGANAAAPAATAGVNGGAGSGGTARADGSAGTGPATAGASGSMNASAGASATGGAAAGAAGSTAGSSGCTRELLKATVDAYFIALAARDSAKVPFAANAKFTENGATLAIGDGLWKTAGEAKLKRSALDVDICSSVTESVIVESGTDIVLGARLKLADAKVTELETIVVREGDYLSNPMALLATASDDWETPLPVDQRATRQELEGFVERYFTQFPAGGCGFASECVRYENGFSPGRCSLGLSCSMSMERTPGGMTNRLSVIDVDAGIGVGFTMFQGRYTDFHMFKVRGGEVVGVHAVLAEAETAGW